MQCNRYENDQPLPTLRRLAIVVIGNTLIATLLWAIGEKRPFVQMWLVAQCIGLPICVIYTAMHYYTVARLGQWPALLVSVLVGFPSGVLLASILGLSNAEQIFLRDWQTALRYMATGVIFTLAFSYFFHSRMQILELEKARQAAELRESDGQRTALLAELRLLQAQIEPHFLFNTLANLHSLIGRDDALARRLLEQLNDYLRASLVHSGARQATLGDECEMLSAYLAIQVQRMGGRLRTVLEVPADLRALSFPPMLLQPLVENAIVHGIEPKLGEGEVKLEIAVEEDVLHITVQDDGVGFGEHASGQGVGLSNVRDRLAALFGGKARLEIKENTPSGVLVELWLPNPSVP